MHLQGAHGDSATAAAEQLMAEEADEAAKAAAKKAKKQKAKARKQQACSQPVASQPAALQSLDSQPLASQSPTGSSVQTLLQSNSLESRGDDLSPDEDPDSCQPDSQHRAAHDSAVPIQPDTTLNEQVSTSGRPAAGMPIASAAAADAFPGADARFLDQLFCCPITKVLPPRPFPLYQLLHLIQRSLPMRLAALRIRVTWGKHVRLYKLR